MTFPDNRRDFLADGIDVMVGNSAMRVIPDADYAESFNGVVAGFAPTVLCHSDDIAGNYIVMGTLIRVAGLTFAVVGIEPDNVLEPGFTLLRLEER